MTQKPITYPLSGGLDLVTPDVSKPTGRVIAALNYEPVEGGYKRLTGYERFDGRTAPSAGGNRAAILAVPGTGPVRGVWFYNGNVYAVRNTGTGTGALYKATAGGWSLVDLGYQVTVDHLQQRINPGDVITGATSGKTATIYATGIPAQTDPAAWWVSNSSNTAFLQVKTGAFTGNFTAGENVTVGGVVVGKIFASFGPYPKVLSVGDDGNYQFVTYDFGSGSKMYWAQGEDFAYEFDGVNPPVIIGKGIAFFTRIGVYRNALFLSGSVAPGETTGNHTFFSVVGDPTNVSDATLGAGEISHGSVVVDYVNVPKAGFMPDGLVILCENHIYTLYGNDYTDYQESTVSDTAGALHYTAQRFGDVIYMDNTGLRTLGSGSGGYGNSSANTISRLITPYLLKKRSDGVLPATSFLCRTNSQYWLLFDDGTGIVVFLGAKVPAILPVSLGITVVSACSVEVAGVERIFLGTSTGFVYELNKGTSFDGGAIEHYIRLPFSHFGSPLQEKRAHKAVVEMLSTTSPTLQLSADYDYGAVAGVSAQALAVTASGGALTGLGTGEAYLDSLVSYVGEAYLDGVARNISLKISGSTSNQAPHTLTGISLYLTPRGLKR